MIFKFVGAMGIPRALQAENPSLMLLTIIFTLLLFLPSCMLSPFSLIIAAAIQTTKTAWIFNHACILVLIAVINPALSNRALISLIQTESSPLISPIVVF